MFDNYYQYSNDKNTKPSLQNLIIDDKVARNYSLHENYNNNLPEDIIY